MSTLEKVISDTGGCGRFQVLQGIAINSLRLVAVWGVLFMSFGNYNPGWRCNDQIANATFTGSDQKHFVYKTGSQQLNTSVDKMGDSLPATESRADPYTMECKGFSVCDEIEFDPGSRTIVTQWGLACDKAWIVSLIISIQMVGLFIGCVFAGQTSERFGRHKALYVSGVIYNVANFVAIFSISWPMYTACLFFVGIGGMGVLCVAVIYSFEFLEPRWRGILGGLPLINFGITCLGFAIFLERDWQSLHITMAVFSTICIVPALWVPESLRWLALHGRVTQAKAVVDKIASVNKCQALDNVYTLEALRSVTGGDQRTADRVYTFLDLFREKSLRGMTIKLAIGWISLVTVYYALNFSVKVFSGDFYINFIIYSIVELPAVLLVAPIANRWGRKCCGFIFFFVSSLACFALVALEATIEAGNSGHATAIFVLASVAKSTVSGGRNSIIIVTGELPPTGVRSLMYAFCMLISRFGAIIAPYMIPGERTFFVSFSILAALLLLTSAIFLTFPETKNRPMADTVKSVNVHIDLSSDNKGDGIEDVRL